MNCKESTISSPYWQLTLREGLESGPIALKSLANDTIFADLPYLYNATIADGDDAIVEDIPQRSAAGFQATLTVEEHPDRIEAILNGKLVFKEATDDEILLSHRFVLFKLRPQFDEHITLTRIGSRPSTLRSLHFAFQKYVGENDRWDDAFLKHRAYAVPFTIGPDNNNAPRDYSIFQTIRPTWETSGHDLRADGWVLSDNEHFLSVLKYNQDFIEFSEIETQVLGAIYDRSQTSHPFVFRYGGAKCSTGPHWGMDTRRAHTMDEVKRRFRNGTPITFGMNRFSSGAGDWKAGFYDFKATTKALGHTLPAGYRPRIHLQSFYDFPCQRFTREDLEPILAKGKEIGCETLYLDPIWDTDSSSTVWPTERLGDMKDFVAGLAARHGLNQEIALHVMGSNYYCFDSATSREEMVRRSQALFPDLEVLRVDEAGRQSFAYCYCAPDWLEEKTRRLQALCEAGMTWFMLDFQRWDGPCFCENHGHSVPSTPEDHAHAQAELIRRVKEKYPHVQVELHDVLVAGERDRRTPMYYLHGKPGAYEEAWAFEYMHAPLSDLLGGDPLCLYYYNLAYEIPLYLHINMKMDNANCLAFWWYASTVRHLGIGGFRNEKQVSAYQAALRIYKEFREFFTLGTFFGIDPMSHVHVLPERNEAVLVLFNLTHVSERQARSIALDDYRLPATERNIRFIDGKADSTQMTSIAEGNVLQFECEIPALSARLLHLGSPIR